MFRSNLDIKLIEGCLDGDVKAQFRLYKKYSEAMYNIAVRIVGNKIDAEDILQDSFITVFTRLDELENKEVFSNWMKRIVINKSVSLIRSKKILFEELNDSIDCGDDDIYEIEESIDPAVVHNSIKELPDGCRTVLVLYSLEGYKHKEIATLMGISESTSKSQYRRALELLSKKLKNKIDAN
jgi:RNA polymerase sigma factor (sigma-70 family)